MLNLAAVPTSATEKESSRRRFRFLHVPKTGGTSLMECMHVPNHYEDGPDFGSVYGGFEKNSSTGLCEVKFRGTNYSWIPGETSCSSQERCLDSAHHLMPRAIQPANPFSNRVTFCVVRHPFSRYRLPISAVEVSPFDVAPLLRPPNVHQVCVVVPPLRARQALPRLARATAGGRETRE